VGLAGEHQREQRPADGPAINASFGQLFYYVVPGTDMPLTAPAGFAVLQNKTTTALHIDSAFLYCSA